MRMYAKLEKIKEYIEKDILIVIKLKSLVLLQTLYFKKVYW